MDGKIRYSPSDLSQYLSSPFVSWMERYRLENPSEKFELPKDESLALLQKKGNEHEEKYLQELKSDTKSSRKVAEITKAKDFDVSYQDTLSAMKAGFDIIYQGALKLDPFAGYTDFLVKVPRPSKLGSYSYEVWDTKLSMSTKPEYVIQLSCYSEMLAEIQGLMPENIVIVLGDLSQDVLKLSDFSAYYRRFKSRFLQAQLSFDPKGRPVPEPWESFYDWQDFADKILKDMDHLIQVAGISAAQIKKFEAVGVRTVEALTKAKASQIPDGMQTETFKRLVLQAKLQKKSLELGKTQFELRVQDVEQAYGLQRLPPEDPMDVYFDMEGFPLVDGGLEYLFGASYLEVGQLKFADWWALDSSKEQKAFEDWIDWAYSRWQKNPRMHIYHYAAYEVTAMKKLMGRYMTREFEVDQFLRNHVFIDLYQVVREGLVVGAESYSIKKLEDLYGFKRSGDVKNAGDSVVEFAKWTEIHDGESWKDSKILRQIRDYNEEDCVSTLELTKWLRSVASTEQIAYHLDEDEDLEIKEPEVSEASLLATEFLQTLPEDETQAKVQRVIAASLGYHKREAKPQFWSYFQRLDAIADDLFYDFECLANCKITKIEDKSVRLEFDSIQDTKLKEGSPVLFQHDLKKKGEITAIDYAGGTLELGMKCSEKVGKRVTLIPTGPLPTAAHEKSLLELGKRWKSKGSAGLQGSAIYDLLTQSSPRIARHKSGTAVITNDAELLQQASAAALNLDNSVLAIQGPPGTGKTFTASHIIAELLVAGKTVGIISNGHKAIDHLMTKVHEVLISTKKRSGIQFIKVGGDLDNGFLEGIHSLGSTGATPFWKKPQAYGLVGGTSWFFAHTSSQNKFDYLFIEEAGQFALANALACAPAAKNLVLLGDQMQLEQPIQGTHPDEIKESVLGYYLKGHATIPPELGVFLGVSRRMRNEVCQFISETFYDGRVKSHATTAENKVSFGAEIDLLKNHGIVFVDVLHEGNAQGSDEEVAEIAKIVKSLKGATISEVGGKPHSFSIKDCLFVAPYNLQVGKLVKVLGDDARVGSVDLFQGQEAPVVFLSMCSSDGDASPRGLDFLLNMNRMNVALSRAKSLVVVVGSSRIAETRVRSVGSMRLVNLFCRVLEG